MTDAEKQTMVVSLVDHDTTTAEAATMLERAKSAILRRLYPFQTTNDQLTLPILYDMLQVELAVRYINRIGAEGEIEHTEHDVSRVYGSVNDEDLLAEVTPYVKMS